MTPKPLDILYFHLIEEKHLFSASTRTKKEHNTKRFAPENRHIQSTCCLFMSLVLKGGPELNTVFMS